MNPDRARRSHCRGFSLLWNIGQWSSNLGWWIPLVLHELKMRIMCLGEKNVASESQAGFRVSASCMCCKPATVIFAPLFQPWSAIRVVPWHSQGQVLQLMCHRRSPIYLALAGMTPCICARGCWASRDLPLCLVWSLVYLCHQRTWSLTNQLRNVALPIAAAHNGWTVPNLASLWYHLWEKPKIDSDLTEHNLLHFVQDKNFNSLNTTYTKAHMLHITL